MASAQNAARLCMMACRRATMTRTASGAQATVSRSASAWREFSTSKPSLAGRRRKDDEEDTDLDLKEMNKSFLENATPEGLRQLDELAKENGATSIDEFIDSTLRTTPGLPAEDRQLSEDLYKDDVGEKPNKSSFWFDEDDPETNTEEHDEFNEDDITSMAHGKLQEVREMRHYTRLAVWDMPLLSKYAKPFEPPKDNQVLRWRYTSYMGESHPAEKKVVVQFAPDDLKLTAVQTEKLKKLVGARYNPDKELVKMSCESFEHQAQNKQYLMKLVDDLIAAAKDPSDTFEDIPLDLRHHKGKSKKRPRFPESWLLTNERRRELDEHRQRVALADVEKANAGLLVDGQQTIDGYLMQKVAEEKEKTRVLAEQAVPVQTKGSAKQAAGARARR